MSAFWSTAGTETSGGLPIFDPPLRLGELVATLALAQDNAFGQPLESQLRSCLLATWMCEAAGLDDELRETVYWVALLRFIGCTGHAHEVSTLFGDEIAIRGQTLVHDSGNPAEVMRDIVAFATAGHDAEERDEIVRKIQETIREWAFLNFSSGCEVADVLVERLDFGPDVRDALRCTFECWNGNGHPNHVKGEAIPLPMRIVHVSHDMEAIGRLFSPERALEAAHERRGETYDPAVADLFLAHGRDWFDRLAGIEPWDAVLALEPEPHRTAVRRRSSTTRSASSPTSSTSSRRTGAATAAAARSSQGTRPTCSGSPDAEVTTLRRAALVHDFGTTVVPNSIWDKPGPLTRSEFDRVELHPMLTEQMLRRSPALAVLNPVASAHHEKCDGSGYHKRVQADADDLGACVLAATEVYVGLTTERADRPPFSPADAAAELRRLESVGVLEPRASRAVLVAAGHGEPRAHTGKRPRNPGGLTRREVDVLRLAARGLTTREIADRLYISPKTADHHIQHIYGKIGVSTRAAAALWAMQHTVVS